MNQVAPPDPTTIAGNTLIDTYLLKAGLYTCFLAAYILGFVGLILWAARVLHNSSLIYVYFVVIAALWVFEKRLQRSFSTAVRISLDSNTLKMEALGPTDTFQRISICFSDIDSYWSYPSSKNNTCQVRICTKNVTRYKWTFADQGNVLLSKSEGSGQIIWAALVGYNSTVSAEDRIQWGKS